MLECASIQSFIFASNKLREIIGGSFLVKEATESFLETALAKVFPGKYDFEGWRSDSASLKLLSNNNLEAEILYNGGGNAVFISRDPKKARLAVNFLSSNLVCQAPGLKLLAAHSIIDTDLANAGVLAAALEKASKKLNHLKESGEFSYKREGLGITRACATTGLAAAIGYQGDWLAASAAARRKAADPAEKKLKETFEDVLPARKYSIPQDLDDLGGHEGENHLAIVHADGNSIGARLKKITDNGKKQTGEDFARTLRCFSSSLNKAATSALQQTLKKLTVSLSYLEDKGLYLGPDRNNPGNTYYPLRPLIFGGDDLTFVCEGRLGLSLAAYYLEQFSRQKFDDGSQQSQPLTACAGVAIIRAHFPLARAYRLSEDLTANAKKANSDPAKPPLNWLDYYITFAGLTGHLSQLRPSNSPLYYGPWTIGEGVVVSEDIQKKSWSKFTGAITTFKRWPRSKTKDLRAALALGESETRGYLADLRNYLSEYKLEIPYKFDSGWDGKQTPLYNPLESSDFYLSLEGSGPDSATQEVTS